MMKAAAPRAGASGSCRQRGLVPALIYLGLLAAVVSSLGAPLVPKIASEYGVSLASAQWSMTITVLTGAVTLPVIGRLGDGQSRLPVLFCVLSALVVGSVLAAIPAEFALFIAGRGLQGVALALVPLVMSIARDHLNDERTRSTLATLSVTTLVGAALGYPVTGLIAEYLNLRAAFWFAASLGVAAIVVSALVLPTSSRQTDVRFDFPGAVLWGFGLASMVVCISEGVDWGWTSSRLLAVAGLSVVATSASVWRALRVPNSVLELRSLGDRVVMVTSLNAVLMGMGMYMLIAMIIRFVQTPRSTGYGLGESVVVAGLVLLPMSITGFFGSKLVNSLTKSLSPVRALPLGAVLFAAVMLMFAVARSSLWQILAEMAIGGAAIGCSFAVIPRLIVGAVGASQTSRALAFNQLLRMLGFSVGSALSASILGKATVAPAIFPTNHGYTTGALVGVGLFAAAGLASWALTVGDLAPGPSRGQAAAELDLSGQGVDGALAGVPVFELDSPDSPPRPTGL